MWVSQNDVIHEWQAGFRRGYSTIDNIFNLVSIIKIHLSAKRRKVYAFFVDFSAAFDHVDRYSLFCKLTAMGLSSKIVKVIRNMYTGTGASIWCQNEVTEEFETTMGVKQGCILSPILFALFINDICEGMRGGVKIVQAKFFV